MGILRKIPKGSATFETSRAEGGIPSVWREGGRKEGREAQETVEPSLRGEEN